MRHQRWEETVEKNGETLLEKKACTEENIEVKKETILNQEYQPGAHPTPVDIAREPNIDSR